MTQQQFVLIIINFFALIWVLGNVSYNLERIHNDMRELNFSITKLRDSIGNNNGTILAQIRDKMK